MKSFPTYLSSHTRAAAVENRTETDHDRVARTLIDCEVKAVNKRQVRMRMLVDVVKVGERDSEVVKVSVEFRAT